MSARGSWVEIVQTQSLEAFLNSRAPAEKVMEPAKAGLAGNFAEGVLIAGGLLLFVASMVALASYLLEIEGVVELARAAADVLH